MNINILMFCSMAACLPLTAMAEGLDLNKELNGLDIKTELVGGGAGASSGPQALKVSNDSNVTVTCELRSGPAETQEATPSRVNIKPGKHATLEVPGKYSEAPLAATLHCMSK